MIEDTLGSRLRILRNKNKLNQEQVARLIKVTKSTICAYENDARQPSLDIIVRLANLYGVSTDYLLGVHVYGLADISGLSKNEQYLIEKLIENMTEKNRKIKFEENI